MEKGNTPERKLGFYEINGVKLPSVTTVIGDTLANPALMFWRGSVGNDEATRISEESKSFGSAMHKIISDYLVGTEPSFNDNSNSQIKESWDVWINWWNQNKITPEYTEKVVSNDSYAGTCDLFGEGTILDWKFGGGIYDAHKIQLGAYARLVGAHKGKIVRVAKKNRNLEVLEMNQSQLEEAAEIFDCLLKIFWWKKK
jgi:hypothetical protein